MRGSVGLLRHAADELRSGTDFDGLRITATKVATLVRLLRRAGDGRGVPLPCEVTVGIDGCDRWAASLAEFSPPSWLPSNLALVLGTLLDQVISELAKATVVEKVEMLIATATGLADLLIAIRQAAAASRVAPPPEFDRMIQGLATWTLDLGSPREHEGAGGQVRPNPVSSIGADRPGPLLKEVQWHLAEIAAALRDEPAPLGPDLLRIVLHGLADLCSLLHERGAEASAQPPSLFRDTPVVAEALAIWSGRLRTTAAERQRHVAEPGCVPS